MPPILDSNAKILVLRLVKDKAQRPTELLVSLRTELSYTEIQEAVSQLLYEGKLRLTSDRQLNVASDPNVTRTPDALNGSR